MGSYSYLCVLLKLHTLFQDEGVRQPPNVMAPEQVQYYFQLSQMQSNAASSAAGAGAGGAAGTPQITQLPPGAHIIQQNGQLLIATPHQLSALAGASTNVSCKSS